jgi:hypothetical protein
MNETPPAGAGAGRLSGLNFRFRQWHIPASTTRAQPSSTHDCTSRAHQSSASKAWIRKSTRTGESSGKSTRPGPARPRRSVSVAVLFLPLSRFRKPRVEGDVALHASPVQVFISPGKSASVNSAPACRMNLSARSKSRRRRFHRGTHIPNLAGASNSGPRLGIISPGVSCRGQT